MNKFVRNDQHSEMILKKNKDGYTLFFGKLIASDAPYERLKIDSDYKKRFIVLLKEWSSYAESEDKITLKQWIADVEELEE